jgi:hypothetical protein
LSNNIQEVFKDLFYSKKIFVNEKKKNYDLLEEVKNYMLNKYENSHKKKFLYLYSAFIIKNKLAKKNLISKSLIKYFKKWRGHTDNSQLVKYQIILEEKEMQFHDMKLLKFFSILRNNIKRKFNIFLAKIEIYSQKKRELEFLANSYIFFENNYNIYLKNVLKGCFKIERIRHKIKKCQILIKEDLNVNIRINEFKEISEFDLEKNKKINFSALDMFKNNSNNNNNKSEIFNIEKNFDFDSNHNYKTPIYSNIVKDINKKYQLNSLENFFYLWKSKSIKYSSLVKNFENTVSNKIITLYDILNNIYIKKCQNFFTKFSHIYHIYKYDEFKFDACEYYLNNLMKKKIFFFKSEFFHKFITFNYHNKINENSDKPKIIYFFKALQNVNKIYDDKNKKLFYNKMGLYVKGSLLYNWSISTFEFVMKIDKILKSRFSQEFLYRLRIKSQMETIFKKPKIDYLIMNNTAEIIKHMHSSIISKTKSKILWKLIKIISIKEEQKKLLKDNNLILLANYFSIWVENLKAEKKMLMNDAIEQDNINVIKIRFDLIKLNQIFYILLFKTFYFIYSKN